MPKALTQQDFDHQGCDEPGCTDNHMVLFPSQSCHVSEGFFARYDKRAGVLTLLCRVCDKEVLAFEIAVAAFDCDHQADAPAKNPPKPDSLIAEHHQPGGMLRRAAWLANWLAQASKQWPFR